MKKQVCILTKSYKNGGYCVAGIDIETNSWIRLVDSEDVRSDEIKKHQMFTKKREINCFDVIEVEVVKHIPHKCQIENYLVDSRTQFKIIDTFDLEKVINLIKIDKDNFFIANREEALDEAEVDAVEKSLFVYLVENLIIEATATEYFQEIRYRYKCSFIYKGHQYNNISLTDPCYRDVEKNQLKLSQCLIIASLPCIPYKNQYFYKFIAKIIPVEKSKFVNEGVMHISQQGFFYSVKGNDALLLNKLFGYKLYGEEVATGFPVKSKEVVLNKLDSYCIDYDLFDRYNRLIISKRHENNKYEILDASSYVPRFGAGNFVEFDITRSQLLKSLASGVNPITGEHSDFIDEKTSLALLDIAYRLEKKDGNKTGFKVRKLDKSNVFD